MNALFKQSAAGLRVLLLFTVVTGLVFPLAVWTVSRLPGLRDNAEGSVRVVDGRAVGSDLIGIDPVAADPAHDPYFHTRPAAGDDPFLSGGSNMGADNPDLVATIRERREFIARRENVDVGAVPVDAVTASASGLDPHISPAYADLQVSRVARENGVAEDRVRAVVAEHTGGRGLGFVGEPTVDVARVNFAVQALED